MDFSNHNNFRKQIEIEYGKYYEKYPNALLLLDFLVQLRVHKEFDKESWVLDRDFITIVDNLIKSDTMTITYGFYLSLASYLIRPKRKLITLHSSIEDNKFPGLNEVIYKIAKKNQWHLISQRKFTLVSFLAHFFLRNISPYRLFIGNKTKTLMSEFRIADKEHWLQLLGDNEFMMRLDKNVKKDISRTAKLVKRLGINIFINTGDSSGNARVLIESSKYFDSKTISFAHGYFSDKLLLGVAPVRSDKLILWTEKQRLEMRDALQEGQKEKLEYIGFPKKYYADQIKTKNSSSLIMMGLIEETLRDQKLSDIFKKIIASLQVFSSHVILRLHPHERNIKIPIIDEFFKETNVIVSINDLGFEISSAQYILGANSSTLVEAASSGKKVYLLEELALTGLDYEGTIKIKSDKIDTIRDNNTLTSDEIQICFDEDEISKKLEELITSLHYKT